MDADETVPAVDPWPEAALPDPSGEIPLGTTESVVAAASAARGRRRILAAGGLVVALVVGVVLIASHMMPGGIGGVGPAPGVDEAGSAPKGSPTGGTVPGNGTLGGQSHPPSPGRTNGPGATASPGGGGPQPTRTTPGDEPPPPPPDVYFSGYVDLNVTDDGQVVDLETGSVQEGIIGVQFDLKAATTGLVRVGGAQIAPEPSNGADPTSCAKQTWSKALNVGQITQGAAYCVRTTEGRLGFLSVSYVILGKEETQLSTVGFGWTIWA